MTLTLLVGAISPRLQLRDGQIVEKKIIQMNLSADHDIIDGAQMMRFIERLKKRLHDGTMSV
jgi:pyruvate/2-oxoglutarate dehydrogenase complex dihydrolipoamide acyltransferase (E2) component